LVCNYIARELSRWAVRKVAVEECLVNAVILPEGAETAELHKDRAALLNLLVTQKML